MDEEQSRKLYHITRALNNPIRLQILYSLLNNGHQNVTALVNQVKVSQPAVSHHMRILADSALVCFHTHGKEKFFDLADDHVKQILEILSSHLTE